MHSLASFAEGQEQLCAPSRRFLDAQWVGIFPVWLLSLTFVSFPVASFIIPCCPISVFFVYLFVCVLCVCVRRYVRTCVHMRVKPRDQSCASSSSTPHLIVLRQSLSLNLQFTRPRDPSLSPSPVLGLQVCDAVILNAGAGDQAKTCSYK